jgi:hypothetical protein
MSDDVKPKIYSAEDLVPLLAQLGGFYHLYARDLERRAQEALTLVSTIAQHQERGEEAPAWTLDEALEMSKFLTSGCEVDYFNRSAKAHDDLWMTVKVVTGALLPHNGYYSTPDEIEEAKR